MNDTTSEGIRTPPCSPLLKHGDVFKSPSSSISTESGVDMKFYSFRCRHRPSVKSLSENNSTDNLCTDSYQNSVAAGSRQDFERPKVKVSVESLPENKADSQSTGSYASSLASGSKQDFDMTPWEAVYAFRQGRKIVKPTFQGRVYNFLERPKEWKSITYHSAIFLAIFGSLLLSVLSTVVPDKSIYNKALYIVEIFLIVVFSVEYLARLWSAGCRSKYLGLWGRLRFVSRPICIIDLIIILSSVYVLLFGSDGQEFTASAIIGVRFLQILRMLHIDREGGCWRLLGSVVMEHRQEMFTALYIGFLGLLFSSYFMFLIEKDAIIDSMPSTSFATYADGLWWGVVTMMTIGYGDKVPLTWSGRLLACISAMFTVSFFALPAGILGSGFALKVQQQQRQKHFSRQIPAAATLIQTLWRCYAADKDYTSTATWKVHTRSATATTNKYNKALAALRRRRPKYKGDGDKGDPNDRRSYGEIAVNLEAPKLVLHQSRSVPDMMISMHDELMKNDGPEEYTCNGACECENSEANEITQLSETHKNAIRAIRKIKYFVAKKKFQQARKPYDVGDIIEQYTQGQIGMHVRLKELHRRLDLIFGKTAAQMTGRNGKPATLTEKLQQIDQQMQLIDKKIDNINFALHAIVKELHKAPPEVAQGVSS